MVTNIINFNVIKVEFDFFPTKSNIFLRNKRTLFLENFDYRLHLTYGGHGLRYF